MEESTHKKIPIKHPVRRLLLTVMVMVVVFFSAEIIARMVAPPSTMESRSMFQLDPQVGYLYAKNHVYADYVWFGETIDRPFYTNNRGLKGQKDYPVKKMSNELRVLCLGDSTTNSSNNDSWPEFLEKILGKALPENEVWVQNGGVSGYSSCHANRLAKREIPAFKPDVVVINVGTNDAGMANRHDSEDFAMDSFGKFIARLGQYSRLITVIRRNIPTDLIEPWSNVPGVAINKNDTPRVSLEESKENIRNMIKTARQYDAIPIVTLYPWLYWDEQDNQMPSMADYPVYLQATWEVVQEENVPYVDLISFLDRPDRAGFYLYCESWGDREVMIENYHMNVPATEYTASEFTRVILEELKKKQPEITTNESIITEVQNKYMERPQPSPPLYLDMVPSTELYEEITKDLHEKNTLALERMPLPEVK